MAQEREGRRASIVAAGTVLGTAAAAFGLLVAAVTPAGSQTRSCSGSSFTIDAGPGVFDDSSATILSFAGWGVPFSRTYPIAVPAGTYVLDGVSYDGYDGRATTAPQAFEIWKAEFLAANGSVLATSGTTSDLQDGTLEAWWSGPLGTVTLAQPATAVRIVHGYLATDASPNSVSPVCVGGALQTTTTTTTTTTPTTTTAPPTSTTPPTSTAPPTSTTPPGTGVPTTTSIPVQVLPSVLPGDLPGTPVPRPQVVAPTFTG